MKLFKKPIFFITVFALVFFVLDESFTYYIGFEKSREESYEKDKLILKNLTDAQAKNIQILAEVLAVDTHVIEGYLQNNPEIIQKHIAPIWDKVRDKKLTHEIHFFKPPAISFVNFSNFKSIGHDVSDVRTDIEWITSSFKASSHALMCKTYAGYRATHPIFDKNGTLLGGLSLGKKVDWIPEAIKEKTKHDAFLIYTKKSTESLKKKYYNHFIHNKKTFGDYILANKTINVKTQDIQKIDFEKNIQDITVDGEDYILYTYPIIDFNKKIMGYVCTVTQLEEFKERFAAQQTKNFILIFLTTILIYLITRKRILNLLKQITYIKNITKKIKSREFSYLHNKSTGTQVYTQSLIKLEKDIVDMGLELEKHYHVLEDENQAKEQQLIKQLYRDELTGLANRNALFKNLQESKDSFVAIFNIRGFKEINDAFGFETGNLILKKLALKYAPYAKENGFSTYRVGSDEFVIINSDMSISKEQFKAFVSEMIYKVENTIFNFDNKDTNISINLYAGVCLNKNKRLEKADMALTQAKKSKKELVVYSAKENTKETHLNNIQIINKVIKALQRDDILVYYQAIVDNKQSINKYEALVRLRDENKILSPYLFLDISKRTKHYSSITKVVIEKTFYAFKDKDYSFSINLTADDILNAEIITLIEEKLKACRDSKKVVFELVESDDLYNLPEIRSFIKRIKSLGAQIAIDDFGTGYSNFSYMMQIQPNFLKIDGSLIKNLDKDENARKIVKTIITFANELNIKTIAEFVHSKEIFDICLELGIDEFQGYYFSEPAPLN